MSDERDIVERLRAWADADPNVLLEGAEPDISAAADEIERLRAEVASKPMMLEKMADLIGWHFAALVSGNNQPDMSGDPRNRLSPLKRRLLDDCATEAARAILKPRGPS